MRVKQVIAPAEIAAAAPSSRQSAQATAWTLLEVIVSQGAAFVTFAVIAHLIGPVQFGIFSLALTLLALVTIVQYYGFADAIVQRTRIEGEFLDTVFWCDVILAIFIVVVAQLTAAPLAALFKSPPIEPLLRTLSFVCLLQAFVAVPTAICRRALFNRMLTMRTLAASVASGVVGVLAALDGYGMWALVMGQFVQYGVTALVLNSQVGWHPRLRFQLSLVPELAWFAGPFMLANGLRLSVDRIGQVAVGSLDGVAGLGWYALAVRILATANGFTNHPLERMTLPVLSRLVLDLPAFADAYRKMVLLVNSIWMPVATGLGVSAPLLIPLVFGPDWAHAGLILQAMCFTAPTLGLWTLNGQALSALGQPAKFAYLAIIHVVLACAVLSVGAYIGTIAAGFAIAVLSLVMVPLHLYAIRQACGLRIGLVLLDWLRVTIATLVMLAASILIYHLLPRGIVFLMTSLAAGTVTYILMIDVVMLPGHFRQMVALLAKF